MQVGEVTVTGQQVTCNENKWILAFASKMLRAYSFLHLGRIHRHTIQEIARWQQGYELHK